MMNETLYCLEHSVSLFTLLSLTFGRDLGVFGGCQVVDSRCNRARMLDNGRIGNPASPECPFNPLIVFFSQLAKFSVRSRGYVGGVGGWRVQVFDD